MPFLSVSQANSNFSIYLPSNYCRITPFFSHILVLVQNCGIDGFWHVTLSSIIGLFLITIITNSNPNWQVGPRSLPINVTPYVDLSTFCTLTIGTLLVSCMPIYMSSKVCWFACGFMENNDYRSINLENPRLYATSYKIWYFLQQL
jgi:hypothetical protein